ncbi:MAG: YdcF family protein [Blastocatellia bacterium]|nr:YdcF family protein [Blastocatellia bacterium]
MIDELARRIWEYHQLHHELERADLILALGSNDLRVAGHAADLYLAGWAPWVMMSGNAGVLTRERFRKPEAEMFAEVARGRGVPESAILIEAESTNTGENVAFSRRALAERGMDPARILLVQKPYMERRAYATFMKVWPGKRVIVSSPPIAFADYPTPELPRDLVINIMVGDLQRIRLYPARGFQIEQEMPGEVWEAGQELIARGYDRHLVR